MGQGSNEEERDHVSNSPRRDAYVSAEGKIGDGPHNKLQEDAQDRRQEHKRDVFLLTMRFPLASATGCGCCCGCVCTRETCASPVVQQHPKQ